MSKKKLKDCKSGIDFCKFAEKKGAEVINGKGSHAKIKNEKGMVVVPRHNKDLPRGTWNAIFKGFLRLGIALFIFVCFINIVH